MVALPAFLAGPGGWRKFLPRQQSTTSLPASFPSGVSAIQSSMPPRISSFSPIVSSSVQPVISSPTVTTTTTITTPISHITTTTTTPITHITTTTFITTTSTTSPQAQPPTVTGPTSPAPAPPTITSEVTTTAAQQTPTSSTNTNTPSTSLPPSPSHHSTVPQESTLTVTSNAGGLQTNGAATAGGSSKVNASAIAGGVIGGAALVGAIIALVLFFNYRRRKRRYRAVDTEPKLWSTMDADMQPFMEPFMEPFESPAVHPYYNAFAQIPGGAETYDTHEPYGGPSSTATGHGQPRPSVGSHATTSQYSSVSHHSADSNRALLSQPGPSASISAGPMMAAGGLVSVASGDSSASRRNAPNDNAGAAPGRGSPSDAFAWGTASPTGAQPPRRLMPTNPDPVSATSATPEDAYYKGKAREIVGVPDADRAQGTSDSAGSALPPGAAPSLPAIVDPYVMAGPAPKSKGAVVNQDTLVGSAAGDVPPRYNPQWEVDRRRRESEGLNRLGDLKHDIKRNLGM